LTQTAAATQAVTVPPPCSPSQPRHAASEAHWKEEQGVCRWQIRTRRARKGVVISWRRRSSVLRCSASSRRCSVRGQRNRRRRERGLRSCSCSSPGLHCVAELHCTAISVHKRSYTNGSNGTWHLGNITSPDGCLLLAHSISRHHRPPAPDHQQLDAAS
jgi:hypothetical protein